jgi:uncharacterized protein YjbI with pentapeptide repeats
LNGLADDQARALLTHCAGCDLTRVDLHGKNLDGIHAVGSTFTDSNLSGASLKNADLEADSFRNADLRNVDFSGAALCGHDTEITDGNVRFGKLHCSDFSGANLRGANLRGVQICDSVRGEQRRCNPLDARTLRDLGHANLDGTQGL